MELPRDREFPREPVFPRDLPRVRKMDLHLAVVLSGVVLAETRSAKELFDFYFIPLYDVRTEYLTPARLRPAQDEIGESQYISIEVADWVCVSGARFYYRPHPPYEALREHNTFDPLAIDAYYINGRRIEILSLIFRGCAPSDAGHGTRAA
jgi:uncharacterized protein (DUF427 family)